MTKTQLTGSSFTIYKRPPSRLQCVARDINTGLLGGGYTMYAKLDEGVWNIYDNKDRLVARANNRMAKDYLMARFMCNASKFAMRGIPKSNIIRYRKEIRQLFGK